MNNKGFNIGSKIVINGNEDVPEVLVGFKAIIIEKCYVRTSWSYIYRIRLNEKDMSLLSHAFIYNYLECENENNVSYRFDSKKSIYGKNCYWISDKNVRRVNSNNVKKLIKKYIDK